MRVVQVRLRSGPTERVCWVDDEKITVGSVVSLKEPEDPRVWTVTQVGERKELKAINKGWRTGGL